MRPTFCWLCAPMSIGSGETIDAIHVADSYAMILEILRAIDHLMRVRGAVKKAKIGVAKPFDPFEIHKSPVDPVSFHGAVICIVNPLNQSVVGHTHIIVAAV